MWAKRLDCQRYPHDYIETTNHIALLPTNYSKVEMLAKGSPILR